MINESKNADDLILDVLIKSGIKCNNLEDLDGLIIPREVLLNTENYKSVYENIGLLKNVFSSTFHTSLQSSAAEKQKWPLLNLVRQLLKSNGYILEPKRICDGYNSSKKKKYKRIFYVKKLHNTTLHIQEACENLNN
tara:strand:+ start:76 stop:486 length:411 start_codon:yes stop_codon:yes gene_type:complete